MRKDELQKAVQHAKCRVYGHDDADTKGDRAVLASLIEAFNYSESCLLCQPSLARKTRRPPDIVLIDPEVGVHVFEVKGVSLDAIEAIEPGGQLASRMPAG